MGAKFIGRARAFVWWLAPALLACTHDYVTDAGRVPPPVDVAVEAIGTTSIRVSWIRPDASSIAGYDVQRRADLTGPFTTVASNVPNSGETVVYFDNTVRPETYYGYRVVAVTTFGDRSPPSTTGGTKTPPEPGLLIDIATQAPNEVAKDPDGYLVTVRGPRDTVAAPVSVNGQRRFSPLPAGSYTVVLRGLAPQCDFRGGDSSKVVTVVEEGTSTLTRIRYDVFCRDPRRGSIIVRYQQDGDTTDPTGVRLAIAGQLTDSDPTDTSTVYFKTQTIGSRAEELRFDDLRKGSYELTLEDVDPLCAVLGDAVRRVTVNALSTDTVAFRATCDKRADEDTAGKPFVLSHQWLPANGPVGTKVALAMQLDLSARADDDAAGVQATVQYPETVLRYDSAKAGAYDIFPVNGRTPGIVNFAAANTDTHGFKGLIDVGRLWFTVIGGTDGATARTSTTLTTVTTSALTELTNETRIHEATFTVGTSGGGGGGGGGGDSGQAIWTNSFGQVNGSTHEVELQVTLDLSADIADTPGAEQLHSYAVDSLKWDANVLQLIAFNFGSGTNQAIDYSSVQSGRVAFSGVAASGNNTGVVQIARLRFRVTGASGAQANTATFLGPVLGTASFDYRTRLELREGNLVVP